jgi:hypothetical protein
MDVKTSFFEVISEVQKDPEDVSAGIGQQKKYKVRKKASYLRSATMDIILFGFGKNSFIRYLALERLQRIYFHSAKYLELFANFT